ncbi:MAG: MFS transporter [Promethearchaeota archaeon]
MAISGDVSPLQYKDDKKCLTQIVYRAWPIFVISFLRLFSISIFERAFLNYIFFYRDISKSTLGFISSATSVAYIIGPILGYLITSKLGVKNSIILSTSITPMLIFAQMVYFDPWYLIFIRVLSGLLLGVYWPNCYNLLSQWQIVSSPEKAKSNFKNFNYSWNLGFILGLLSGYLWAFSLNEYGTMIISWLLSFLLLPFCVFLRKDSKVEQMNENLDVSINNITFEKHQNKSINQNSNLKNNNHPMIKFPILFSWIVLFVYTMSKALIRFTYPVFLKDFGQPSYYSYLNQLAIQIGQLSGLTLINYMKVYSRKLTTLSSILMILFISLSIIIIQDILFISIVSATIGIFIGLTQGTSLRIMIDYGAAHNTKKYSTINEILKGIGFGLTPIAAGFVAEFNIYINFVFLSIFGIFALGSLIFLSRNVH